MKRKIFLQKLISISIGGFLISPLNRVLAGVGLNAHWHTIIDIARWCPSVHNLQPHKVKIVNETEAEIYYDPKRLLPHGDKDSIFSTVAMGIFIENMSVVANEYEKKIDIYHIGKPIDNTTKRTTLFVKIKLVDTQVKEEINSEHILSRRTARAHYNGKPLDTFLLTKISNETEKYGYQFYSSTEKEIVDLLIEQNEETLFEDLESDNMREELKTLFRYSKQEAEDKHDGLWSRCMGFPGFLMKSIFNNYETWDRGLLKKSISSLYKTSFKGTATIGWIVGDFDTIEDRINFGRLMARNWLFLTKGNAYIQPFGSLLTNEIAYQKLCLKLKIPKDKKICMIFRVGYSKIPTRSYRLPLNQIIIQS